jgi:hypothetical protein
MKLTTLCFFLALFAFSAKAQDGITSEIGRISGNVQLDGQYYTRDTAIGAEAVSEKLLSNSFLNLNYSLGNFNAGLRYEAYLNPILGYDPRYKGYGIAYRFAEFNSDVFSATAGNFYEQFGSGMIFRAYQEQQLGFDNAMDGLRVKLRPAPGIEFTGIIGKQRSFWTYGEGIVRGGDLNINVNDITDVLLPASSQLSLGASLVSKFQPDQESVYNLPQNVLAYSTRANLSGSDYSVNAEYAYKFNDPNATNEYNFNPGTGLLLSASYFKPGFGVTLEFHRTDNMDFRSDRAARGNNLNLGFFPPLTKQQTYMLATLQPFATQLNGEIGIQAEVTYTIPKGSLIGGDYGTILSFNFSRVNALDTTNLLMDTVRNNALTYESPFPGWGKRLYFQEFNAEITRKWSKKFKSILSLIAKNYDRDIMEEQGVPTYGKTNALIGVADLTYMFDTRHSLRMEFQHMWASQDSVSDLPDYVNGNWAMILSEYTIAPAWFFSVYDEYNYGNDTESMRLHYLNGAIAYITGATRISLGYGRQRGGLICVGGVCRPVPASNGAFLSITSSF